MPLWNLTCFNNFKMTMLFLQTNWTPNSTVQPWNPLKSPASMRYEPFHFLMHILGLWYLIFKRILIGPCFNSSIRLLSKEKAWKFYYESIFISAKVVNNEHTLLLCDKSFSTRYTMLLFYVKKLEYKLQSLYFLKKTPWIYFLFNRDTFIIFFW